ncbi:MAG: hypothetical protein GY814_06855 [Gammaproteobacteria bacterium]|nr:hypothetical protein [Gammaproteobacteria bacterium]
MSENTVTVGNDMKLDLIIPNRLAEVTDNATASLTPGGKNTDLTISGNTVGGSIFGVSPGTYTLAIIYSAGATTIAIATKDSISVTAGSTSFINVLESDIFTDIDNDNDGFSNLAEVRIGTDTDDDANRPNGGSPAVSAGNGSFTTATTSEFGFSIYVGAVAGSYNTVTNNATDYEMTAGFKGFEN